MSHNTTDVHLRKLLNAEIGYSASVAASSLASKEISGRANSSAMEIIDLPQAMVSDCVHTGTGIALAFSAKEQNYEAKLAKSAQIYLDRRDRTEHPAGHFTNGNKWFPSAEERCFCCIGIRQPSWAYPWSLNKHCRSIEHIAELCDVDATDLRRAVRKLKQSRVAL